MHVNSSRRVVSQTGVICIIRCSELLSAGHKSGEEKRTNPNVSMHYLSNQSFALYDRFYLIANTTSLRRPSSS